MSLHVESYGQGAPLLLIHGWGMHSGVWGSVAERLAENFRVHCVDLPGHGFNEGGDLSRPIDVAINPDQQLDSLVDELSAQFSEPVSLCGWSLSGQIAMRWALRHPQQVQRLVLVASTPCFVQQPDWPWAMSPETLDDFSTALLKNPRATLMRFVALQARGSEREREVLSYLRERVFSRGEHDVAALQAGLEILRVTDLRGQIKQITQATLVFSGERDLLTPPAAQTWLAHTLPNARLQIVAGAAHAPFVSHADIFVQHTTDFMHE